MNTDKPVIYIIDDESQSAEARTLSNAYEVEVEYLYPTAVTSAHLQRASLLAVDHNLFLREHDAPEEDLDVDPNLPIALVPEDGIALAAVLRSAAKKVDRERPLGLAIRSGALGDLTAGLPQAVRQPLVADQHDLEWVVAKESGTPPPGVQLVSLAQALASYPTEWGNMPARELGTRWLNVPQTSWSDAARVQIGHCRPPVEVTSSSAHGLAWLRWLAHQILPFPTFVVSDHYVAASLGITIDSLRALTSSDAGADDTAATPQPDDLALRLRQTRYEGPLFQMLPDRFWRAGIDALIREVTDGARFAVPGVIGRALLKAGADVTLTDLEEPVVVIDQNYAPLPEFVERTDAVRLTPDGWPPYADPAWADPGRMSQGDVQRLSVPPAR